jgi:hypothetical protein
VLQILAFTFEFNKPAITKKADWVVRWSQFYRWPLALTQSCAAKAGPPNLGG